jgi:hypothetical protein
VYFCFPIQSQNPNPQAGRLCHYRMKTPREILLERHQTAAPKLDAICRAVLAELNHQDTKSPSLFAALVSWCLGGSKIFWRELVFPCRQIWAGLAAVWILIVAANVSLHDHSTAVAAKSATASEMASFRDQQKWLNELLADRSMPADAELPRIFSPKPRTEIVKFFDV